MRCVADTSACNKVYIYIGSLFKFKNCLSLDMKSHVVYRLDCLSCSAGYNGVTARSLPARVQEHRDALKSMRSSAVADHSLYGWDSRRGLV